MFQLEIEPVKISEAPEKIADHIETTLREIFPKKIHFEDLSDFLNWAEEAFPLIDLRKDSGISRVIIFSWYSSEFFAEYYAALLKKRLISKETLTGFAIQHYEFGLKGISDKKFCLMEIEIPEKDVDESYVFSLKMLAQRTLAETHPTKETVVQQVIEKARNRFHQWLEGSILEEMKLLLAVANREFKEQRSFRLLARLIISQHFMQKTLMKSAINAPEMQHAVCRLLPAKLSFPFTSKTVLGVFVGIHFQHKYEFFSEEHLLRAIQKILPDSRCIPGSIYAFQRHKDPFKFLYLEIEKEGGEMFSLQERKLLSHSLKEQAKWSIEKLQSSVFMITNEEEVAKIILVLSREIRSVTDLAQVMIHFEEQTENEVVFRLMVVRPFRQRQRSLEQAFLASDKRVVYLPSRTQTVRLLRKKHPIQAHVFRLSLPKTPSLLRSDASLNFYAARNQIAELLTETIGPFRDYNGGIILKQGETLEKFKGIFRDYSSDLLENFFYGLTPLEIQASIPLDVVTTLFGLYLEGKNYSLSQKTDYVEKYLTRGNYSYSIFRTQDAEATELLQESLKEAVTEDDVLIHTQIWDRESHILGYIFESQNPIHHERFLQYFQRGMSSWKSKLESLKTFRLVLYSSPISFDPRIGEGEDKSAILKMLFEGLTYIDQEGRTALGVAQSVKFSRDKKIYTFCLRSTVWSNGEPVTAEDFVYAWKTVLSPQFKTPFAYLFYPIKNAQAVKEGRVLPDSLGVRALDPRTLEIELENPIPYFLDLVALPHFFPINQKVDSQDPSWATQQGEKFVCNGAFVVKKNHPIQGYELVKNQLYPHRAKIQLDRITIKKARVSEIQELLLQDQIDWAGFPMGFVNFPPLHRAVGEPIVLPNELLHWYVFNTQKFPFNYPKLRQALSLVVNRVRILQHIPPGSWPSFTILPLHQTRAPMMEENREKGIRLFQEALRELGLTLKTFPIIKVIYTEGGIRSTIAKIIQEEWEETLGINCSMEAYEWRALFTKMSEGDFQVGAMDWIARIDDPSYTLDIFRKTNTLINFPKWNHQEYEKLLDQAGKECNPQKRLSLYALAEEILLKEAAILPLLRTLPQSIKKSRIGIHHYSSMKSWDFKWASIQASKK